MARVLLLAVLASCALGGLIGTVTDMSYCYLREYDLVPVSLDAVEGPKWEGEIGAIDANWCTSAASQSSTHFVAATCNAEDGFATAALPSVTGTDTLNIRRVLTNARTWPLYMNISVLAYGATTGDIGSVYLNADTALGTFAGTSVTQFNIDQGLLIDDNVVAVAINPDTTNNCAVVQSLSVQEYMCEYVPEIISYDDTTQIRVYLRTGSTAAVYWGTLGDNTCELTTADTNAAGHTYLSRNFTVAEMMSCAGGKVKSPFSTYLTVLEEAYANDANHQVAAEWLVNVTVIAGNATFSVTQVDGDTIKVNATLPMTAEAYSDFTFTTKVDPLNVRPGQAVYIKVYGTDCTQKITATDISLETRDTTPIEKANLFDEIEYTQALSDADLTAKQCGYRVVLKVLVPSAIMESTTATDKQLELRFKSAILDTRRRRVGPTEALDGVIRFNLDLSEVQKAEGVSNGTAGGLVVFAGAALAGLAFIVVAAKKIRERRAHVQL